MKIEEQLTDIQREEFSKLRESPGWEVVSAIATEIIKNECSLEDIDEKLSSEEYKSEAIGRKKAKKMFTSLFNEVNGVLTKIENKKIDYS